MTHATTSKRYLLGTHRARPPSETWEAVRPHLRAAGITRVADVTALDRIGIPVWQAVRPASRNLSVSQGKGASAEAARVSAAMEALELWHAENLDHLPSVQMSVREMAYASGIEVEALRWSSGVSRSLDVPIDWVRAWALTDSTRAWLPRAMLELDFTAPERLAPRMFDVTSNGLASGNTLAEATLHALCELVERHALHETDAGRLPALAVGLGDHAPDYLTAEIGRVRAAGLKIGLWSITWLPGLPTFLCRIVCREMPRLWTGSGCHPSPAVAASRAVTEAVQSRLTWIAGARDDIPGSLGALEPDRIFRDFDEPCAEIDLDALLDGSSDSIDADLDTAVHRLDGAGHTAYRVDLTRTEVGVPVVYAFAPGLQDVAHG